MVSTVYLGSKKVLTAYSLLKASLLTEGHTAEAFHKKATEYLPAIILSVEIKMSSIKLDLSETYTMPSKQMASH